MLEQKLIRFSHQHRPTLAHTQTYFPDAHDFWKREFTLEDDEKPSETEIHVARLLAFWTYKHAHRAN